MTLWRLEVVRLFRSMRWLILAAVYGVFGVIGPLTARYLEEIIERFDESAVGSIPEMTAADGITQYVANAQQIGILAIAFVAAAALAIDTNTELSVFFRTRATIRDIFTPRYAVNAIAAVVAFSFGAAIAYVLTGVLMEWLEFGPFIVGVALQAAYLVFAVAVVGLMASFVRKTVATALLSVGVLIVFGLLTLVPQLSEWLPSELAGAIDQLIRGGDFEYWRALIVTIALIVGLPWISIWRLERREV